MSDSASRIPADKLALYVASLKPKVAEKPKSGKR